MIETIYSNIKEFIDSIKYAYQRVVRGYDDRIFWDFEEYLQYMIPVVKKFCEFSIKENIWCDNKILEEALSLIKKIEDSEGTSKNLSYRYEFWKFFGENIGTFWN
jgi:hypothetical protein